MPEAATQEHSTPDQVASREAREKAERDARSAEATREAQKAADAEVKRLADEREATKANLDLILTLRGLARALSPHGSASLAGALDGIANAITSGKKPEEPVLVEVALALKDSDRNWNAMVKRIEDALRPSIVQDRTVVGILRAVENKEVTVDQGQQLLQEAPKVTTPDPNATDVDAEFKEWQKSRNKKKPGE
jgi:hypothetical protein